MNLKVGKMFFAMLLLASSHAFAATYAIPSPSDSIIGQIQYNAAVSGDTVVTVAERFDLGYNSLETANPHLDMKRGFVSGAPLQIPTEHLLPNQPRNGIVINLPEMRLYYFPEGSNEMFTFPIGIGKVGKTIPIEKTSITRKAEHPTWTPPDDIREFNLQQGIVLPKVMPPGPDNPLGAYAIYMRIPTYLIHSTIFPESVGRRASFGCIRMYESDIKKFFPLVTSGIPVAIINSPVKVGWEQNRFYMEAHPALEEHTYAPEASLSGVINLVTNTSNQDQVLIDWQAISYIAHERDGLPHEIGIKVSR